MKSAVVIDSSALLRRQLTALLESARFTVFTSRSGREGVSAVAERDPGLVTLDAGVSDLSAIDCLDMLLAPEWRPVVVFLPEDGGASGFARELRSRGAALVMERPDPRSVGRDEKGTLDLLNALNRASVAQRPPRFAPRGAPAPGLRSGSIVLPEIRGADDLEAKSAAQPCARRMSRFPIYLIGSSTGGPKALQQILPKLPAGFAGAVVIAQHMPKSFTETFAKRIGTYMSIPVQEVATKTPVEPGNCYIAAGGSDCVFSSQRGRIHIGPVKPRDGARWCPSVDRMVETAMRVVPIARLRGVQLTGIGNDGAAAMSELHGRGAPVLAESEESCVVFGMPGRLIELGGASKVLHQRDIAAEMTALI